MAMYMLRTADFDYHLPTDLIAQSPASPRDHSQLMVVDKTKHTIEQISSCDVLINEDENSVGLIGSAEQIEEATTAITNLIRGSKQANVYRFLERMNAEKRQMDTDLGLKIKKKE